MDNVTTAPIITVYHKGQTVKRTWFDAVATIEIPEVQRWEDVTTQVLEQVFAMTNTFGADQWAWDSHILEDVLELPREDGAVVTLTESASEALRNGKEFRDTTVGDVIVFEFESEMTVVAEVKADGWFYREPNWTGETVWTLPGGRLPFGFHPRRRPTLNECQLLPKYFPKD